MFQHAFTASRSSCFLVFRDPLCQNFGVHPVISFLKRMLPSRFRRWLNIQKLRGSRSLLPLDRVTDFSQLRSTRPHRPAFGWFRGQCIDRVYIEQFLSRNQHDIRGRCLEIGENQYMSQFGATRINEAEILDAIPREGVTIVADLTDGAGIDNGSFDCVICTQVLMCIYDVRSAVDTIFRILAPGGVALVTVAGISQIAPPTMMAEGGEFWRFTRSSAQRLFADRFGPENIAVETFGNVLAATAFLHGLVAAELTPEELSVNDPDYPVTIAIRAKKQLDQVPANA